MNCNIEKYIINNFKELQSIANKITKGNEIANELLQECLLQLYEKESVELRDYSEASIKYYITAIMRINYQSKTSPFHYRIRKESQNYLELYDDYIYEPLYDFEDEYQTAFEKEKIISILEEEYIRLDWSGQTIFDLYIVLGSIKKVAKKTRIPVSNVARYIKEIRTKIKSNMISRLENE